MLHLYAGYISELHVCYKMSFWCLEIARIANTVFAIDVDTVY